MGGILNILVLFGKIICSNYNSIIYINRVIEKSFPKPKKKYLKNLIYFHKSTFYSKIVPINKPRSRLRFFSYLCPISRIKIYYSNVQRFYELADIGNILKRLQDLDKLKWTFFQSNENKFYDLFPLSNNKTNKTRVRLKETDGTSRLFEEIGFFFEKES